MSDKATYEIQQDNANHWRVIRTGADGIRRAIDHPPCRTRTEAKAAIVAERRADREMLRHSLGAAEYREDVLRKHPAID